MDIGQAIAIFLAIAIIVMILFCLVTKYFNYKLQKALQQNDEVYSMIDQINSNDQIQGEYQQFMKKRQEEKEKKKKGKNQKDQFQFQMTDVRDPLIGSAGVSLLRKRLDGQTIPMKPQTNRSSNTMRSFAPEGLQSNRSRNGTFANLQKISQTGRGFPSRRSMNGSLANLRSPKNGKNQPKVIEHTFLSKIVAYTENGLEVIQNQMKSLKKGEGNDIAERKVKKVTQIKSGQKTFQDQLQVYGFDIGQYGAYKFITKVQIPHMKDKQDYPYSALKNTEQKHSIDFLEYYKIKSQLDNQY